jgi:hypothetical protein
MIAPQLPTGIPIRDAIFDDDAECQCDDAVGIVTPAGCHIGQVSAEILATRLAVVLRVGDVAFLGASRNQVTDIMQRARVHPVARCRFLATRTGALNLIAVFFDNLGLGQVFDPGERSIGFILAGP